MFKKIIAWLEKKFQREYEEEKIKQNTQKKSKPLKKRKLNSKDEQKLKKYLGELKEQQKVCHFCNKQLDNWLEKYNCKYCGWKYCTEHRLPHNHDCTGKPIAPR